MTDTEKSLLDAVCADPFDDATRLVAADWYDDNGQWERAEFIRERIRGGQPPTIFPPGSPVVYQTVKPATPMRYVNEGDFFPELDITIIHIADGIPGVSLTEHRGFISEVTLTLAQFMGGSCRDCDGRGDYLHPTHYRQPCKLCKGTGTTPGLAATLVDWPLTEVRLSDREPQPNSYGGPIVAWHSDPNESWMPSWIPYHLLRVMAAIVDEDADLDGRTWLTFPTSESAHLALGRAAVDYTRALRGRPAMRWE